jgi:hypothetical protein
MFSETHIFSLYISHNTYKESGRDNAQASYSDEMLYQKQPLEEDQEIISDKQRYKQD